MDLGATEWATFRKVTLPMIAPGVGAARELADAGWSPCAVHKDVLAGEDDLEDADWVVELATGPDDQPASAHRGLLEALARRYDGFVTD